MWRRRDAFYERSNSDVALGDRELTEPSAAELQTLALRVFGRSITIEQAEAYRPRLPTFAWAVERVQALADALGDEGPATVFRSEQFGEAGRDG